MYSYFPPKLALFAFLAFLTTAAAGSTCNKTPSSDTPSANTLAIYTPGQNQVVPVDRPFTITWDPTAGISSVSIVLLIGPSTNVVPLSCIVNSAPNTGNFIWTPSSSLTPSGNSGYGLQIIDDATGKFQYSTQFGISNPGVSSSSSSSSFSSSSSSSSSGAGTATATATQLSHNTHNTASGSESALSPSSSSHKPHHPPTTSILVLPSPSAGFPSPSFHSKNSTTHHSKHHSSSKHHPHSQHIGTGTGTGGSAKNATHFVTPTKHITKPSSLGPVTSVVVAQTSVAVSVSSSSSVATSPVATTTGKSAAAAVRVVKAGLVVGLGALGIVVFL